MGESETARVSHPTATLCDISVGQVGLQGAEWPEWKGLSLEVPAWLMYGRPAKKKKKIQASESISENSRKHPSQHIKQRHKNVSQDFLSLTENISISTLPRYRENRNKD